MNYGNGYGYCIHYVEIKAILKNLLRLKFIVICSIWFQIIKDARERMINSTDTLKLG